MKFLSNIACGGDWRMEIQQKFKHDILLKIVGFNMDPGTKLMNGRGR